VLLSMLLMSLACDAIALGSNQVEVEVIEVISSWTEQKLRSILIYFINLIRLEINWYIFCIKYIFKGEFDDTKGVIRIRYYRRTDNTVTMVKRKGTKGQTTIYTNLGERTYRTIKCERTWYRLGVLHTFQQKPTDLAQVTTKSNKLTS
jgi:hypothetical protein